MSTTLHKPDRPEITVSDKEGMFNRLSAQVANAVRKALKAEADAMMVEAKTRMPLVKKPHYLNQIHFDVVHQCAHCDKAFTRHAVVLLPCLNMETGMMMPVSRCPACHHDAEEVTDAAVPSSRRMLIEMRSQSFMQQSFMQTTYDEFAALGGQPIIVDTNTSAAPVKSAVARKPRAKKKTASGSQVPQGRPLHLDEW